VTATDLFIVLGGISLVVVAAAGVPMFLQLRRTYAKAELLIDRLNQEAGPLCQKVTAAAGELELLAASLTGKIDQTEKVFHAMEQSANTLLMTSNLLKDAVRPIITNVGGLSAGVRAFTHFLFRTRD